MRCPGYSLARPTAGLVVHGEVDHVLLAVAALLEDNIAVRLFAQVAHVGIPMRDYEQHVAAALATWADTDTDLLSRDGGQTPAGCGFE